MAVTSTVARRVCTKSELKLFTESLGRNIKALSAAELKSRVARSRTLRDKYRQLAKRQDREARGKQQPRRRNPSLGSKQTRKKEQIFAETLERFERRSADLRASSTSAGGSAKKKTAKKKAAKKAPKKSAKQAKAKSSRPTKKATSRGSRGAKRPAT